MKTACRDALQQNRNNTKEPQWYPEPFPAIRQQKTGWRNKHQPCNPRRRCCPRHGAADGTGLLI